jgi:rhamnosyltransferase
VPLQAADPACKSGMMTFIPLSEAKGDRESCRFRNGNGAATMNKISIVIRCKNEQDFIGRTLQAVYSQKISVPFEVIVVDSGSTDQTLSIVREFAELRLFTIPPESFTFGHALNYGIEKALGTIICNLSAHCIPCDDSWLQELTAPIINCKAHATFGRQTAIKGVNPLEEMSLDKHFSDRAEIAGRLPFSNANCAFLRHLWSGLKFDEELSAWEDYLWYTLLKDRYTFQYCPKGAVYHSHPFSIKGMARRSFIYGSAFKLIKKKYSIDLRVNKDMPLNGRIINTGNDILIHIRRFFSAETALYILLMPVVKFITYISFRDGYNSIK